jgi:hypothetical protein
LLHGEDLSVECGELGRVGFGALGFFGWEDGGGAAGRWRRAAYGDAIERAERHWGLRCEVVDDAAAVGAWVRRCGLERVVAVAPCVGPLGDEWGAVVEALGGCQLEVVRRPWDTRLYPEARAGFFPYWKAVRPMLERGELA